MQVYILRHGIAEDRRPGRSDTDRALTGEGREKLSAVLQRARAAGVSVNRILTSPLRRAVQTAEMAAGVLAPGTRLIHADALSPESSPERVWAELRKYAGEPAVLIAGHEPLLSETAGFLLGAGPAVIDLKKGALACIDVDETIARPQGVLLWLLTPRLAK